MPDFPCYATPPIPDACRSRMPVYCQPPFLHAHTGPARFNSPFIGAATSAWLLGFLISEEGWTSSSKGQAGERRRYAVIRIDEVDYVV
eukprot:5932633-Pleurochrysis_carterae.AAC.1